jgi:16S rRNA (guanine966-N2)-methyltransferase
MSSLQPRLRDAHILDLYAGSGALGLEALSRGAASATFVDDAPAALRAIHDNAERLGALDQSSIVRADALEFAAAPGPLVFDITLADPPYASDAVSALVTLFLERRFARELWVEHRAGAQPPGAEGARTRRYGDTAITSIPVSEVNA